MTQKRRNISILQYQYTCVVSKRPNDNVSSIHTKTRKRDTVLMLKAKKILTILKRINQVIHSTLLTYSYTDIRTLPHNRRTHTN